MANINEIGKLGRQHFDNYITLRGIKWYKISTEERNKVIKEYKEHLSKEAQDTIPDVLFDSMWGIGAYSSSLKVIMLDVKRMFSEDIWSGKHVTSSIVGALMHEYIHHIILRDVGYEATKQFDNIAYGRDSCIQFNERLFNQCRGWLL